MLTLTHLSDLHFDHCSEVQIVEFAKQIISDVILITGDISTSHKFRNHIFLFERYTNRPIYYVLGNHDFYYSSINEFRNKVCDIDRMSQFLKYLSSVPYIQLSNNTAIIGHDGWYDANNIISEEIYMNDWSLIKEYATTPDLNFYKIAQISKQICNISIKHIADSIAKVTKQKKNINNIIVATHVPPFEEIFQQISKSPETINSRRKRFDILKPWYLSNSMGILLKKAADTFPHIKFSIFCGHLHENASVKIKDNLYCYTSEAIYSQPRIGTIFVIE